MRSHYLEYIMIILVYVQYDHPYIVRSILIELSGGNLGQVADHAREHPLAQLPPRRTHARMPEIDCVHTAALERLAS
jgi:hypothetical protein